MVDKNTNSQARMQGLFKYLVKEEFRFHTELFGLARFVGFPLFIILLISAGLFGAVELDLGTVDDVLLSVHGLFFILALQIGSVAFMASDAANDLLGDRSTLLYSHTYLPITQERLILVFAIKDVLFYLGLFVAPAIISMAIFLPLTIVDILLLTVSLGTAFAVGISTALFISSLGLKSRSQSVIMTILVISSLAILFSQTPLELTDVLISTAPSLVGKATAGIGSLLIMAIFSAYAARNLELSQESSEQKVRYAGFIKRLLNPKRDPDKSTSNIQPKTSAVVTRTFSDVLRSGGGLFKIGFTIAILVGMTAYLLNILNQTTQIAPQYVLTTTSIIALASYANYVWIFQDDSLDDYNYLPLNRNDIKSAKRYSFHLLNTTLLVVVALTSFALFGGEEFVLLGTLFLIPAMSEFYFEYTFTLASFDPMDFLFDTLRFNVFSVVLMLLFLPILIVGLFGILFLQPIQIFVFCLGMASIFWALSYVLIKFINDSEK